MRFSLPRTPYFFDFWLRDDNFLVFGLKMAKYRGMGKK